MGEFSFFTLHTSVLFTPLLLACIMVKFKNIWKTQKVTRLCVCTREGCGCVSGSTRPVESSVGHLLN